MLEDRDRRASRDGSLDVPEERRKIASLSGEFHRAALLMRPPTTINTKAGIRIGQERAIVARTKGRTSECSEVAAAESHPPKIQSHEIAMIEAGVAQGDGHEIDFMTITPRHLVALSRCLKRCASGIAYRNC